MGRREDALLGDEAVTRLRFDFPHPGENERPLVFEQPSEIIEASDVPQVRGALAHADLAARAGKWVAGFVCYEAGAAFDPAFRFHGRPDFPLVWFGVFDKPSSAVAQTQGAAPPFDWALSTSRPRYERDIATILENIRAGDVYPRIITELETRPRVIYCGAIGMLQPGGDGVFNVAIRTLAVDTISGSGQYGVGSGITADSLARDEYDEVLAKCLVVQELPAID